MALSARLLLVLALIAISEGQENSTDLPSQETTSPETGTSISLTHCLTYFIIE